MAKFCSSCGTQLAPAARFCTQCGATVPDANDDQEVIAVTSPSPTINQEARAATEQDKQPVSQQPSTVIDQSKGAQNKLMKRAGLAALVFLVGWGVFAALPQAEHQYDPKRLGFTDKAEMDAAFAKGYHTKQKLVEMTSSVVMSKNREETKSDSSNLNTFKCNTERHIVLVTQIDTNTYNYKSWNKPNEMSTEPNMNLTQANVMSIEGTGECRYVIYKFSNSKVVYEVRNGTGCYGEIVPPENAIGSLNVFINDELKSNYWCSK